MEQIFLTAVELPEADRAAFVAHACGADAGLLAEVEALLQADREGGSLIAEVRRETRMLLRAIAGPLVSGQDPPTK